MKKTDFDAKLKKKLMTGLLQIKQSIFMLTIIKKKLKTFHSSYFKGKSHFEVDSQNCLVFQPIYRYFKRIASVGSGNYIYFWKSKGLSDESLKF